MHTVCNFKSEEHVFDLECHSWLIFILTSNIVQNEKRICKCSTLIYLFI